MEEMTFDVELTTRDLFVFSMRHTYFGASGIFGLILSVGCLAVLGVRFGQLDTSARLALAILGCLFTVVQPVMLYTKAASQVRKNKDINAPLHYTLTEQGIAVAQGEQNASVKWCEVRKCVAASGAVYLYMSPVRAFIFPAAQCGEAFEKIRAFAVQQTKRYRDYDPETEERESDDQSSGKPE